MQLNEAQLLSWFGVLLGITVGGYIPTLWGNSLFSAISLLGSVIGGVLGVLLAHKIAEA